MCRCGRKAACLAGGFARWRRPTSRIHIFMHSWLSAVAWRRRPRLQPTPRAPTGPKAEFRRVRMAAVERPLAGLLIGSLMFGWVRGRPTMMRDYLEAISWEPPMKIVQRCRDTALGVMCSALLVLGSLCEFAVAAPDTASTTNTQDERTCSGADRIQSRSRRRRSSDHNVGATRRCSRKRPGAIQPKWLCRPYSAPSKSDSALLRRDGLCGPRTNSN